MANEDLYINTDSHIEVVGLQNAATGTLFDNTATVQVTLLDASDDSQITGETWPLSLSHVVDGTFRGVLKDTLSLATCMQCKTQWVADWGSGLHKEWEELHSVYYASIAADFIVDNSDHLLTLQGLQDPITSSYINNATVTVTLKDLSDTDITGETWPLTMVYIPTSDGDYRATLRDTLGWAADDAVKVLITATGPSANEYREWRSVFTITAG